MTFKEKVYQKVNADKELCAYMKFFENVYLDILILMIHDKKLKYKKRRVALEYIEDTCGEFYSHLFKIPEGACIIGPLESGMEYMVTPRLLYTNDTSPVTECFFVDENFLSSVPDSVFDGFVLYTKTKIKEKKQENEIVCELLEVQRLLGLESIMTRIE